MSARAAYKYFEPQRIAGLQNLSLLARQAVPVLSLGLLARNSPHGPPPLPVDTDSGPFLAHVFPGAIPWT